MMTFFIENLNVHLYHGLITCYRAFEREEKERMRKMDRDGESESEDEEFEGGLKVPSRVWKKLYK